MDEMIWHEMSANKSFSTRAHFSIVYIVWKDSLSSAIALVRLHTFAIFLNVFAFSHPCFPLVVVRFANKLKFSTPYLHALQNWFAFTPLCGVVTCTFQFSEIQLLHHNQFQKCCVRSVLFIHVAPCTHVPGVRLVSQENVTRAWDAFMCIFSLCEQWNEPHLDFTMLQCALGQPARVYVTGLLIVYWKAIHKVN